MTEKLNRIKPAVDKRVLLFLSGLMWVCVGTLLLLLSHSWLTAIKTNETFFFSGIGFALALVIHHFGFLKIVDKNLGRILSMEEKRCIFSFMSWKSYFIVALMATMGVFLRHSAIPKPYLSVLYTGIGLALILSSIRYLRILYGQIRKQT